MGRALDRLRRQLRELAFRAGSTASCGSSVVEHDVYIEAGRHGGVDRVPKAAKLLSKMPQCHLRDYLATGQ
jgi:hypothetical protein